MAFGSGSWYRRQALLRAGLGRGMKAVDVGVGTGLVARQAALLVGDPRLVTGVDPSPGMLENAQVPEGVQLLEGCAESIPLPDASVDFLSMGYALRHVDDLQAAFREFRRVLAPGGKLCILEITLPSGALGRHALKFHLNSLAPLMARIFGRHRDTPLLWRYYWDTIEACAPPERVLATLESVGFEKVRRELTLGVFSEYQATAV
jgi:demethylmenaquinone methyltransferase/2-methoxy-6-polyprenyl-1,4-benzoquinol methylase